MLTYSYDEAISYLEEKLAGAQSEFETVVSDLKWTRNQIITSEVNMSRIYNWDVKNRRLQKAMETAEAVSKTTA